MAKGVSLFNIQKSHLEVNTTNYRYKFCSEVIFLHVHRGMTLILEERPLTTVLSELESYEFDYNISGF